MSGSEFSKKPFDKPNKQDLSMRDIFDLMEPVADVGDLGGVSRSVRTETFPGGYAVVDRRVGEDGAASYDVSITKGDKGAHFSVKESSSPSDGGAETSQVIVSFGKLLNINPK